MTPATGRPELERWLASAAFNAYFGFRLREFGAGECTIEAPFRDEFVQIATSAAAMNTGPLTAPPGRVVTRRGTSETWVTADLKTAFLRAARREPFTCTARVLKIGRQRSTPSPNAPARTEPR